MQTKIPPKYLLLVSIFFFLTTMFMYSLKEQERDEKISVQKQLERMTIVKKGFEVRLKEEKRAMEEMSIKEKAQDERIGTLSAQLEDAKTLNSKTVGLIREKEENIKDLNLKLVIANSKSDDLEKQLENIKKDYLSLKEQADVSAQSKENLEKKVKELSEKEEISLGTIVIKQ